MCVKKRILILPLILMLSLASLTSISCDEPTSDDKFYYFAYGSNLLSKRLLIHNPSAKFYSVAKLENYRLDFNLQLPGWNGAVATICEDPDSTVWGTVWTLDLTDVDSLDEQEGVKLHWYFARNVTVTTADHHEPIVARTYIEVHNPKKLKPGEVLPPERQPSITYIKVIIQGAIESGLPLDYIVYLRTNFPYNGKLATKERRDELGFPFLD